MLKINLAYPERSDINFEIINFPDGHKHLKLESCPFDPQDEIQIITRFRNMDDLFLVSQANVILKINQVSRVSLNIPYLLTSRCDRFFSNLECKDFILILNLIETMKFHEVITYDVHNFRELRKGITNLNHKNIDWDEYFVKDAIMAYPDLGAKKRYSIHGRSAIYGIKERKGRDILEYTSLNVDGIESIEGKDICVRDDLIDGGLTFIKFAELLKQHGAGKLYLYATHGIFSKGYDELLKHYEHIWCANSYRDIEHPKITCIDVYE